MNTIQESPEHHFLTFLEKLKQNPDGWAGLHLGLSRSLDHDQLIENLDSITEKLRSQRNKSLRFYQDMTQIAESHESGMVYHFTDNDVLMLACLKNAKEEKDFKDLYKRMSEKLGPEYCESGRLGEDLYGYQKLADHKFLTARRMEAYEMMTEKNKVASIAVRRHRRDDPLVLIVEDDRFTASYASNILNKEYDLIHAKTGEDGIVSYIESAPDIALLDIHLPGLSGHQTLNAIKKVDPEAYAIMLSVDTEKTNVLNAHVNGAHGFLKKPFSKDRLLATVQKSPFIRRVKAAANPAQTTFFD